MIGERIRQARHIAGLSQEALADALTQAGYPASPITISEFEDDKDTPTSSLLHPIADVLGMPIDYFADDFEFPKPSQLLAMPESEREKWIMLSIELAKGIEFEQFDAFGEEYF
ncbi:MAG: helix-turn-helix domain-containing protein [Anaerolineae bacterium]|jgi:transcriptional regulator with XRE-family HTH domain|nr:helix-turn-helix domain-containing protein [Anaerolineae bacterium]